MILFWKNCCLLHRLNFCNFLSKLLTRLKRCLIFFLDILLCFCAANFQVSENFHFKNCGSNFPCKHSALILQFRFLYYDFFFVFLKASSIWWIVFYNHLEGDASRQYFSWFFRLIWSSDFSRVQRLVWTLYGISKNNKLPV